MIFQNNEWINFALKLIFFKFLELRLTVTCTFDTMFHALLTAKMRHKSLFWGHNISFTHDILLILRNDDFNICMKN